MESQTLHLVLKSRWYYMIEDGIKKEEYRSIGEFWRKRFCKNIFKPMSQLTNDDLVKHYKNVCFHYGYTNRTMTFELLNIRIDTGRYDWGAMPGEKYFVLTLGERIS